MSFLIKDLELALKSISLDEFKLKKVIGGYQWVQELPNRTNIIGVGHSGYPNLYRTSKPHSEIFFNNVETLLDKAYRESSVKRRHGKHPTIRGDERNIAGIDYKVFDIPIKDKFDYPQVLNEVKKIIEQYALPFFEQYNTLEKVWEATEKKEMNELINFIGQPLPHRRMIIKKLCNDPNYEDYAQMVLDYLKKENDPEFPVVQYIYDNLQSL